MTRTTLTHLISLPQQPMRAIDSLEQFAQYRQIAFKGSEMEGNSLTTPRSHFKLSDIFRCGHCRYRCRQEHRGIYHTRTCCCLWDSLAIGPLLSRSDIAHFESAYYGPSKPCRFSDNREQKKQREEKDTAEPTSTAKVLQPFKYTFSKIIHSSLLD